MRVLYPFQTEGVSFLRANRKALLYDDPGLGKSTQALAATGSEDPVLVLCPSSVKRVWETEAREVRPGHTVSVLSGRKSFRWPAAGEIVVINYDILPDPKEMGIPAKGTRLVMDEAHYLKSTTSRRSQRARAMGRAVLAREGSQWGLTGTPLVSWPPDLWGVHYALNLETEIWGSYRNFFYLFRGFQSSWGPKWGKPRDEVPTLMRALCLGRKRETVLPELPTKVYRTVRVTVGSVRETEDVSDSEVMIDAERSAAGAHLSKARAALALAKASSQDLQAYLRLLSDESPLVVFSAHRSAVECLAGVFETRAFTGSTPAVERGELVDRFKRGDSSVLFGTIGAMGVGLTLTNAHRVVFLDRAWTPADNIQSEDRVCRITQTRGVEVIDVVAEDNDLDQQVFQLLRAKSRIINQSIEAARV